MIVTYVFPGVVLLIPLYQLFGRLGLIDNLWSLIIMNVTFSAPFSVWLMRGFFTSIPQGIEEAAALDGAGPLRTLWSIIMPLTAPGLAVAAMYTFVLSVDGVHVRLGLHPRRRVEDAARRAGRVHRRSTTSTGAS